MARRVVTLTSDFTTADGYVGAMKGVILARAPGAILVDVTHDIPPGDVLAAAFAVAQAAPHFPRGSVHLVVVDPGVGSARKGVVLQARGHFYVGPDNGVLARVADGARGAWEITARRFRRSRVSPTFHGRDVFAPAAAALALGARPEAAGPAVTLRAVTDEPGRIVHIDRFGNLVTDLAAARAVRLGGRELPLSTTYSDVAPGELVAYLGSAGTIEIGVRDGSAAQLLGVARGTRVEAVA